MLGESSEIASKIVCTTTSAGFTVEGITELYIDGLAFVSCGHSGRAAIHLEMVKQSLISNCSFQDGYTSMKRTSSAVYIHSSTVTLTENTFQNNFALHGGVLWAQNARLNLIKNVFHYNSVLKQRLIHIWKSTVTLLQNKFWKNTGEILWARNSMLNFTGNTFQYNSAPDMILVRNSALKIIGNGFESNTASGHMLLGYNSSCNLTGNIFQDNFISESVLQFENKSVLHLTGNTFRNNTCVLFVSFSILNFTGNSLRGNSGLYHGAVFINQSHANLTGNVFYNNFAKYDGGVLYVENANLTLEGNTFQNNSAGFYGGALYVQNTKLTLKGNIFLNNSAIDGGVFFAQNVHDLIFERNTFQNNLALNLGGMLYAQDTIFTLKENILQKNSALLQGGVLYVQNTNFSLQGNTFQNNFAGNCGGVLYVLDSNLSLKENTFQNNSVIDDGAVFYVLSANLTLKTNTFEGNSADDGGVLFVEDSNLSIIRNTFQNNLGSRDGGALHIWNTNLILEGNTFQNNSAAYFGGTVYTIDSYTTFTDNNLTESLAQFGAAIFAANNNMTMYGYNKIENNAAKYGGGVLIIESHLQLVGNTIFENNTASYGGGLHTHNTNISGHVIFANNVATEGGGGIYASKSILKFASNTTFMHNSAVDGGGILLSSDATLSLQPNTHIYFRSNSAKNNGGAIKVADGDPLTYCFESTGLRPFFELSPLISSCFFQIEPTNKHEFRSISTLISNISLHFEYNSAAKDGAILYGGSVDNCDFGNSIIDSTLTSGEVFDAIVNYRYIAQSSDVSSEPLYICTCENKITDCSGIFTSEPIFPGGTLEVPVIAYGQRNGTATAVVQVINTFNITVYELENTQSINDDCTTLRYTVQSLAEGTLQEMTLYAEGLCPLSEKNTLKVLVETLPCPPGFQLAETQKICICAGRLQQFTNTCMIDTGMFLRREKAEFWVSYGDENKGLILHSHCPFDYCVDEEIYVAFNDSDSQCNYNRSGLLCGRCGQDLSLALGSSRCLKCSNSYFALFAMFILAGIVLVLLLFTLRLTVAAGTINGVIFYANVVAVNSAIFFQPRTTNILTIFISWLNLDLGIETCFYNGLDAYAKTWLQFIFPLYVWVLAGVIICVSYYSSKVASLFGSNPIAVLATLFLLSYAKLLRTIIAALSFTSLEYPNQVQIAVWLYDGNIPFFGSKHVPLFAAAVVCLLFLFLPYTILLIFGQWLLAKSGWKPFSWINNPKLKPFLDAYHAPFTDKNRYWPGLMLLLRFLLFLVSAFNVLGNPIINFLAISFATVAVLAAIALFGTKIYKTWSLNLLEISFMINLTILVLVSYHVRLTGGNQNAVIFTSVGVAFATFVGIIVYHTVKQMKDTRLWRRVMKPALSVKTQRHDAPQQEVDRERGADSSLSSLSTPTTTVVDLHDIHINDDELREPCMETNYN